MASKDTLTMEWISNANTVAGLILAIFGIGGYIFAVAAYLKNKTFGSKQAMSQTTTSYPLSSKRVENRLDVGEWISILLKGTWYFMVMDDSDYISFDLPMGCIVYLFFSIMIGSLMSLLVGGILLLFGSTPQDLIHNMRSVLIWLGIICSFTILLIIYARFLGKAVENHLKVRRREY